MSTFGIRQTFRTQPISRKIARTDMAKKEDSKPNQDSSSTQSQSNPNENLFETNQNYFVNRVLNRSSSSSSSSSSSVQKPLLTPINQVNQTPLSQSNKSTQPTQAEKEVINSKMVSSRISLMKSHNRAVTRSEDHM